MSRARKSSERRRSRPGRSTSRQPDGCRSTGRSTRNAVPRPIMSAPTPRAGNSGTCGRSGSSPSTVLVASAGSVPGIDPTPVATPANCCSVTAATLSGPRLSVPSGNVTGMYAEHAPAADLVRYLRCSWTRRTGGSGSVLPDGCLDLMWINGELVVAGPDTVAARAELPAGVEIAAVRFRPGAAPAVLGPPRPHCATCGCRWPSSGRTRRCWPAGSAPRPTGSRCWRTRSAGASPTPRPSTRSPSPSAAGWPTGRRAGVVAELARRAGCPSGSCTAGA